MIQRIQSIYYLIAMILVGFMTLWPLAQVGDVLIDIHGNGTTGPESPIPFPLSYIGYLIIALTVICIWMYKDRKKQLILGRVNYFLLLAYIVVISLSIERVINAPGASTEVSYNVSLFLPLFALGFLFLANRAVKKDEDLVRSLDRLR
jgi:hypothetical protein